MTAHELRSLQRRRRTPLWASAGFIFASTLVLLVVFGTGINPPVTQQGAALVQP